jgi:hypothetical protein
MPNTNFDPLDDDVLLDGAQTRAFFGGKSEMFIYRREQASRRERERRAQEGLPAEPGPGETPLYPLPKYIGARKYQRLGDLKRYAATLPQVNPAGRPHKTPKALQPNPSN